MKAALLPMLMTVLLLAGCHQNMVKQPRYDDYERSPLAADGTAMQPPPDGTIAQDQPERTRTAQRPPLTPALLARGRARYAIYCAMCHGADGQGNGIVVVRGFHRPPSLLAPVPPERVYRVIGEGAGTMYGFADRVGPADRWAIAAYVRALQAAGNAG